MLILIIEDETLVQRSLRRMLELKGHQVHPEATGRRALELLAKNSYDLIICDLMLGDITGFDVIEECRRFYTREQISERFVIITAYSSAKVLEKASEYRCKVIQKPFDDTAKTLNDILPQ